MSAPTLQGAEGRFYFQVDTKFFSVKILSVADYYSSLMGVAVRVVRIFIMGKLEFLSYKVDLLHGTLL